MRVVSMCDLATQICMAKSKSTICTILKNKEAIKGANVAKGIKCIVLGFRTDKSNIHLCPVVRSIRILQPYS